jgi:hypothetical protein
MSNTRGPSVNKIKGMIDFRKSFEYVRELKLVVNTEFIKAKEKLIQNFEQHPVTREIEAGVNASNTSNTLGGKGNLFSFIGFESSDNPTQPIYYQLRDIVLTSIMIKRDGTSRSYVLYPSAEDIFKITPLPWADGRSWAEGIEKGISNLGQFLSKPAEESRSGGGIQSKNPVSSASFSTTPYISSLISDFEKDIIKINSLTL